jgi:DNA-binding winged helix-turn-helix (wHTH) protein
MPLNLNEIHFEVFRFSVGERCLFRGDQLVALTPKEFEILGVLLEFRGQVVQKTDLYDKVWPDKKVEISSLFHHVKALRSKLGIRENGQPYIETVRGRGYRFLADADIETVLPLPQRPLAVGKWLIGLAALVIVAGGGYMTFHRRSTPAGPRPP